MVTAILLRFRALGLALCVVVQLAACGNSPTEGPKELQIAGVPLGRASVGRAYEFVPRATDPKHDPLVFSITGAPSWAVFDTATGSLRGTPGPDDHDSSSPAIDISVTDGTNTKALPTFSITVGPMRKTTYGHYFAARDQDRPTDVAMLCEQAGVSGVVWRQTWNEVEPAEGTYDFRAFDEVLEAIAGSHNPQCQLWLFVTFKSFSASPQKNPCPEYLQAQHSGLNDGGNGAATCFMWEPDVVRAYVEMMKAAAA